LAGAGAPSAACSEPGWELSGAIWTSEIDMPQA
jgi:hypothetical protein